MTEQELIILLADVEGAGVSSTRFGNQPMFWKLAKGCNVYSLNGDKYLDCTSSYVRNVSNSAVCTSNR